MERPFLRHGTSRLTRWNDKHYATERGDLRDGPIILTRRNEDPYAMERSRFSCCILCVLRDGTTILPVPGALFKSSEAMWLNKFKERDTPGAHTTVRYCLFYAMERYEIVRPSRFLRPGTTHKLRSIA